MSESWDKQRLTFFPLEDPETRETYENIKPWISIPRNKLKKYVRLAYTCPLCKAVIPKIPVPEFYKGE